MRYSLVLRLAEDKNIDILERENLLDIDLITTKYEDKFKFLEAYTDENIKKDLEFNLVICFRYEDEYHEVGVLYKDNKKKLRPRYLINSNIRYLKESDEDVLSGLLDKFIYMFASDFNIERRGLFYLVDSLKKYGSISTKNELIKIIEEDFNTSYNKRTKTVDDRTYNNIRLIDNYITGLGKKNVSKIGKNYYSLLGSFYDTLERDEHLSMSEVAYLYDEFQEEERSHYRVYTR